MPLTSKEGVSEVTILRLKGMSRKVGTPTSVTVTRVDNSNNVLEAKGTTVPSDGDAGYAVGAMFTKTDGTPGGIRYVNEGSATSADFNAQQSLGAPGATQYAEVSITNAEMLALRATPKTLVAAPGAGKFLEFVSLQLFFDYTGAYTETTDNMAVRLTDGTGIIVSQAIEATGFVDAAADTVTNALPKIDAIAAKTAAENKALVLHNTGDGEYGGGNAANVVRAKVTYRIHSTGF